MSITTSREEREEAVAKVAEKSDEQLRQDLAYWAVTTAEHQAEFVELTQKRQACADLHEESQAWVGIITTELWNRRRKLS